MNRFFELYYVKIFRCFVYVDDIRTVGVCEEGLKTIFDGLVVPSVLSDRLRKRWWIELSDEFLEDSVEAALTFEGWGMRLVGDRKTGVEMSPTQTALARKFLRDCGKKATSTFYVRLWESY